MIFSKRTYFIFTFFMLFLIVLSYFTVDKSISLYFIKNASIYKEFGKTASMLGESHWYIGIALIGLIYSKFIKKNELYKNRFLFLLYANIFSGFISIVSKMFFGRLRPWKLENGEDSFGFLIAQNPEFTLFQNIEYHISMMIQNSTHYTSFPSGHATTSFAVFTFMSIIAPKYIYLWLSITLLGVGSRILANDHFLSDVFAGALVGTLATLFVCYKLKLYPHKPIL